MAFKENSFAIEHDKTRASLQNAFEGLFSKYGRSFESDDEIDIIDLKVVKKGRTLEGMRPLEFGEAFHKKKKRSKKQKLKRLKMKLEKQKRRKLERPRKHQPRDEGEETDRQIYESIRGVNNRIVEAWPERDFETYFKHICNNERESFMSQVCKCRKVSCFDCLFLRTCIVN